MQVAEAKQGVLKLCAEALAMGIRKFPDADRAAVRAQKLLLQTGSNVSKVSFLPGAWPAGIQG